VTALLLIAVVWTVLALPFGVLLGRAVRLADRNDEAARARSIVPDFIPPEVLASVAARQRRES
jgi:hypothetical protein